MLASGWSGFETWQRAREQRTANVDARREVLEEISCAETSDPKHGVFDLLVAARRLVRFQGRRQQLAQLGAWCSNEAEHPVMTLLGPAGIGKTRLAIEFALSLSTPWATGWLVPGRGNDAVSRLVACGDPTLVLVDNADTRIDLVAFLDALANISAANRPHVILTMRDRVGPSALMRRELSDNARWLSEGPEIALGSEGSPADRQRWYRMAVHAFARARRVPPPDDAEASVQVRDADEPILVVQARALLDVLNYERGLHPRTSAGYLPIQQIAEGLLGHEAAWWTAAASGDWGIAHLGYEVRERTILALILRGAASVEAAGAIIRLIPELTDAAQAEIYGLIRWVIHLYPNEREITPAIQPDLLAGWYITSRLSCDLALADALLKGLDEKNLSQVLTKLARAAMTFPGAIDLIMIAIRSSELDIALRVAVNSVLSSGPIPELDHKIASLVAAATELDEGFLDKLDTLIPPHFLPDTRIALATRWVEYARAEPDREHDLARALGQLGNRLKEEGYRSQALVATQDAVTCWRRLATNDPPHECSLTADGTTHLAGLARVLVDYAGLLSKPGLYDEALAAVQEAAGIYRELASESELYTDKVASTLVDLGSTLDRLGRSSDAVLAIEEAIALYRTLAMDESAYVPGLTEGLLRLSSSLSGLGRYWEAVNVSEEAVTCWRGWIVDKPAELSGLAGSLYRHAINLGMLGRHQEAIIANKEAVLLYQGLARNSPSHLDGLAGTLTNLGVILDELGRNAEALEVTLQAVGPWRRLADEDRCHLPNLVTTLINLGNRLAAVGRDEEALTVSQEAAESCRELAADDTAYLSSLGTALNNLGNRLAALRRHEEALAAAEEAVAVFQTLAVNNPVHEPSLATVLINLSSRLHQLNRHEDEFSSLIKSLTIWRALKARDGRLFSSSYGETLVKIRRAYINHGRENDAVRLELPDTRP